MKRLIPLLITAALLFGGCASSQQRDPFQVDTVIRIPVDPTEEPTEPEETQTAPTNAPTEPKATTPKKNSSSKGSSSGNKKPSSSKKEETTEPSEVILVPWTDPPVPTDAPTEPPYDPSDYVIGSLEYAIADELNDCRAEAGESELSLDGTLSGIAYVRAQEAAVSWNHTRPDGRGYASVLSDYGYAYAEAAELMIYASGSGNAENMVSKWMSSESHSAKILSGSFFEIGIGVYDKNGVTYVVCLLIG